MARVMGIGGRLDRVVVVLQPGRVGLEESALINIDLVGVPGPDFCSYFDVGGRAMFRKRSFESLYFLLGPPGSGCGLPLLDSLLRRFLGSLCAHLLHMSFPNVGGAGAGKRECCRTEWAPLLVRPVSVVQ